MPDDRDGSSALRRLQQRLRAGSIVQQRQLHVPTRADAVRLELRDHQQQRFALRQLQQCLPAGSNL
jgi:hypothetical protein